jgi:hypothetical protein
MPSAAAALKFNLALAANVTTTTAAIKAILTLASTGMLQTNAVTGRGVVVPFRAAATTAQISQNPLVNGSITNQVMGMPVTVQGPLFGYEATSTLAFTTQVSPSGTFTSYLLPSLYLPHIVVGLTSSQGGLLNVQRYIDKAGTVAQGAALTQTLTAAAAAVIDSADGKGFGSYTIQVTNSSGTTPANISGLAVLLLSR